MASINAFWSYVHADDDHDKGRIAELTRDVTQEIAMITGETPSLFLDADRLGWGEDWRERIQEQLIANSCFIPVMTPRYFMSKQCRDEVEGFARTATELGVKELVLPLYYVTVPAVEEPDTSDHIVKLVRTFRWEDWRELRFKDLGSESYRAGVNRLAQLLVDANRRIETVDIAGRVAEREQSAVEVAEEIPGLLDDLAAGETALPELVDTIQSISRDIETIGSLVRQATQDIDGADRRGQGFVGRLSIIRRLAHDLGEPVDNLQVLSNQYVSQLHDADGLVRAMTELAPAEVSKDADSKAQVCAFFESVKTMSKSAHEGLDAIGGMIENTAPIESMSRDLRPVLKRLREGLTVMIEAREITDEWVRLIDSVDLDCREGTRAESY
jgi:hypothetical protein